MHSQVWGSPMEYGQSTEVTPLKKPDSPCPRSHQLSIALQFGEGAHAPFLLHGGVPTGLLFFRTCSGNLSLCEFMSAGVPLCPEDTVSLVLWLLQSSHPVSVIPLFPTDEGYVTEKTHTWVYTLGGCVGYFCLLNF